MAAFVEMFSSVQMAGKVAIDDLPESSRMIHFGQMGEFVHDDIVLEFTPELKQERVEGQTARRGVRRRSGRAPASRALAPEA